MDITEIIAGKVPHRETAWVLLDGELETIHTLLLADLEKAQALDKKTTDRNTAPAIEEKIEGVEDQIRESRVPFIFEAVGREVYGKLLDEYKPRDDESHKELDEEVGFNVDEFPPRLFALAAFDPKMELEDARLIWNTWSDAETTLLLAMAVKANRQTVDVPFTLTGSSMGTRFTGRESSTPAPTGSPSPASS